jgi:hypothetical protein
MTETRTICRRVRLNSQGYAYGGWEYFGIGEPLYYVAFPDGRSGHVRAVGRAEAIKTARERREFWGIY